MAPTPLPGLGDAAVSKSDSNHGGPFGAEIPPERETDRDKHTRRQKAKRAHHIRRVTVPKCVPPNYTECRREEKGGRGTRSVGGTFQCCCPGGLAEKGHVPSRCPDSSPPAGPTSAGTAPQVLLRGHLAPSHIFSLSLFLLEFCHFMCNFVALRILPIVHLLSFRQYCLKNNFLPPIFSV